MLSALMYDHFMLMVEVEHWSATISGKAKRGASSLMQQAFIQHLPIWSFHRGYGQS